MLRDASFCCSPQPVAVFAMKVCAGNPGFTCRPGLAGSMIISFLKALYAHVIVGSRAGRQYAQ